MKNKEKRIILILLIVVIVLIGIILIATKSKPNKENTVQGEYVELESTTGTKINTSNQLKEEKDVEGLTISNIELTQKDGQTRLDAEIKNTTGEEVKEAFYVDIILYNKIGDEIGTITGLVTPMKKEETKKLSASIDQDYTNAYDFKVVKKIM